MREQKLRKSKADSRLRLMESVKKAQAIMPNVVEKAEQNARMFAGKPCVVFYCYDEQHLQFDSINLPQALPYIVVGRTSEIFYLIAPAFKIDNTYIYLCVREFPISIVLDLTSTDNTTLDGKQDLVSSNVSTMKKMIPRGMSAAEIRAKIESIYTQRIYRLKKITDVAMVLIVVLPIIVGLIVYVFTSAYYNPPERILQNTNSTISIMRSLATFLMRGG